MEFSCLQLLFQKAESLGELEVFANRKDGGLSANTEEETSRKEKPQAYVLHLGWLKSAEQCRGLHTPSTGAHRVQEKGTGTQQLAPVSNLTAEAAGTMWKQLWLFQYLQKQTTPAHTSFPCHTRAQCKPGDRDTTLQRWGRVLICQWPGFIFFQPEEIQIQNTD